MSEHPPHKTGFHLRRIALAIIFLLAAAIRTYPFIFPSGNKDDKVLSFADSRLYATLAYNIYYGKGFSVTETSGGAEAVRPFFNRAPGYPYFMSLVMLIFEKNHPQDIFRIVCIAQGILDAFCALLIFLLARMFLEGAPTLPLVSAALYCFCPYNIYYSRAVLVETLAAFLLTMFVVLAVTGITKKQLRWFFYAGLLLGCLVLTRPEYLLFIIVFACFLPAAFRQNKRFLARSLLVYLAGIILVSLPWGFRNYLLSRRPILVSVGVLDSNLYYGTYANRKTWRGYSHPANIDYLDPQEKAQAAFLQKTYYGKFNKGDIDEILALEAECKKLALRRIFSRPFQTIANWIFKIPNLWYQNNIMMYKGEPGGAFFIFYFVFAVYAFFSARGLGRVLMGLVATLFVYLTIIFVPLYVEPRFSVPLMPAIISLSGIGIGKALGSLKKRIWPGYH